MASLAALLRGEREALDEVDRLDVIVRREGDLVEIMDIDEHMLLGFMATRGGIVIYYMDATTSSTEIVFLDDLSLLENVALADVVSEGAPLPPSVWLHSVTGASTPPGRICVLTGDRVKCKQF